MNEAWSYYGLIIKENDLTREKGKDTPRFTTPTAAGKLPVKFAVGGERAARRVQLDSRRQRRRVVLRDDVVEIKRMKKSQAHRWAHPRDNGGWQSNWRFSQRRLNHFFSPPLQLMVNAHKVSAPFERLEWQRTAGKRALCLAHVAST